MLGIIEAIKEKILEIPQTVRANINILIKFLPLFSFLIPFLILYSLYPESFEATWKGRTYHLFFLLLFLLEIILNWEELQTKKISDMKLARKIALIISLLIPTAYVIVANFCGLNYTIEKLAEQHNIPFASWMPLSTEYVVFAALFALIILLEYGISGSKDFAISTVFLGVIGVIYTIDNVYPYGRFTPFQILVPTTTMLAANILNLMGYETTISFLSNHPIYGSMPILRIEDSQGRRSDNFAIGWPCSGVESLLIYTVTILLFLKKSGIPWKHRIIYFVIGGIVTYFINILRIVTIFVISINGGDIGAFHDLYGQLYSISWIVSYPLIIVVSRALWEKIRNWKTSIKDSSGLFKTTPK